MDGDSTQELADKSSEISISVGMPLLRPPNLPTIGRGPEILGRTNLQPTYILQYL